MRDKLKTLRVVGFFLFLSIYKKIKMTIFRSYFSKNNTLIDNNLSNNSQNPVTEISYGTVDSQVTRFIFDIDLDLLRERITEGFINPEKIVKHILHVTNTISNAQEYIGKRSYSLDIERATSFNLDLFNVTEDWDEGSGYDFAYADHSGFMYVDVVNGPINLQASNWYYRQTDVPWTVSGGSYVSGVTEIFGTQRFENGSEDVNIDITDYVNGQLGISGVTGYTGTTYGLGLKFPDSLEELKTIYRQAVGFHAKETNTFYEPYIETVIDDAIRDDRNYFFLDKENSLYLYMNIGNYPQNVTVNSVEIYDHDGHLVDVLSGSSISQMRKGIYKVTFSLDSSEYPDAVLFTDKWNITVDGKIKEYENQFYLISDEKYYTFDLSNQLELGNYSFYFWGLNQQENVVAGDIRKIRLTVKELYPNQDDFLPLDVEYRLYTTVGEKYEIDIIPFTSVDRTSKGYEFDLDTAWLIPQDYCLQLRLKNGSFYENKKCLKFTVVSNDIKK